MYAIVEIAGQQFKVQAPQKLKVHRLELEEGKHVELGNVLLVSNGGKTSVGTPMVDGARIAAKVLTHSKGDKVLIGKKKRRKGYQKVNGHRQYLTELWIEAILAKGEKFDASKSTAPPVIPYTPAVKKSRETVEAAPVKKVATKKAAAKKAAPAKAKTAPKKAAAKKASADDLKKVEGIGPKIAEILNEGGINTFAELAAAKPAAIKEMLDKAGSQFSMHDPGTWPKQAKLAAADKWDELKKLQDELNGGK